MEWRDQGIILSLKKYGEFDAILEVFTREHGRHAGIVKAALEGVNVETSSQAMRLTLPGVAALRRI